MRSLSSLRTRSSRSSQWTFSSSSSFCSATFRSRRRLLPFVYVGDTLLDYDGSVQLFRTRGGFHHLLFALLQRRLVALQRRLLCLQGRPQRRQVCLSGSQNLIGLRQSLLRRLGFAPQRRLLTLRLDELVVQGGLLRSRSLHNREAEALPPAPHHRARHCPLCAAAGRRACASPR